MSCFEVKRMLGRKMSNKPHFEALTNQRLCLNKRDEIPARRGVTRSPAVR